MSQKNQVDLQLPTEACCKILMTPSCWRWIAMLLIEEETVYS